ncbi:MAG: thioredoxin-disulfide reductase [Lachnospiraceae bacterium]|nr:thioredoxin-disulfide reductase [Lachnospiraceae bacterium]
MYDIIVVGAGTAGLSAAIYGVRAGKKVLVLEEKSYGGQIINTPEVENYPGIKNISGFEFATNLYEQAKELGAEIVYERVRQILDGEDKKQVITGEKTYEAKSVIIATGAKNRPLGLEGEKEFIGAGISYCATCDGMFFRGKDVAVVGGGNTALEDTTFLSNYCNKVYLIHRRDEFRGDEHSVNRLKQKENVEFVMESRVTELAGEGRLDAITVEHIPTGELRNISVAGLFVAIGQMPDNEAFRELIDVDVAGYICATEDCKTKVPGVFTAGDCRTKTVRQLTTAAADGAVAALAACEYIG